jgi:hypothetical protein
MSSKTRATPKNGQYLSTLERGLSVLRSFTRERPEMTLSEVAAAPEDHNGLTRVNHLIGVPAEFSVHPGVARSTDTTVPEARRRSAC